MFELMDCVYENWINKTVNKENNSECTKQILYETNIASHPAHVTTRSSRISPTTQRQTQMLGAWYPGHVMHTDKLVI